MSQQPHTFDTFAEFYPFYLQEHANVMCRRLHFVGTSLVLSLTLYILLNQMWALCLMLPVLGYGFAWIGHYFFEKNRPATFKHPLYSFVGDFVMFKDMLIGKINF